MVKGASDVLALFVPAMPMTKEGAAKFLADLVESSEHQISAGMLEIVREALDGFTDEEWGAYHGQVEQPPPVQSPAAALGFAERPGATAPPPPPAPPSSPATAGKPFGPPVKGGAK